MAEIETPCFQFSSLPASAYRLYALPGVAPASAASAPGREAGSAQRAFGGGRFFGRFAPRFGSADAAPVPLHGGSFLVWRVHRLPGGAAPLLGNSYLHAGERRGARGEAGAGRVVIDVVELPFVPRSSPSSSRSAPGGEEAHEGDVASQTRDNSTSALDIGPPCAANGGAVRLVLPAEAGVVPCRDAVRLEEEEGNAAGCSGIVMKVATACGGFYRVRFAHPCGGFAAEVGRSASKGRFARQPDATAAWRETSCLSQQWPPRCRTACLAGRASAVSGENAQASWVGPGGGGGDFGGIASADLVLMTGLRQEETTSDGNEAASAAAPAMLVTVRWGTPMANAESPYSAGRMMTPAPCIPGTAVVAPFVPPVETGMFGRITGMLSGVLGGDAGTSATGVSASGDPAVSVREIIRAAAASHPNTEHVAGTVFTVGKRQSPGGRSDTTSLAAMLLNAGGNAGEASAGLELWTIRCQSASSSSSSSSSGDASHPPLTVMKRLASIPARSVPGLSAALRRRQPRQSGASTNDNDLFSVTAVSFGPEGTHFAAVLTMRESTTSSAHGEREIIRVVRLNGQVDPAAAEEAILSENGSGGGSPVMMVESFLRVLQSGGRGKTGSRIPGLCFDEQSAATTATTSSICVAAHLGVVDGGRDPNMVPSLKLMLLVRANNGDDEAADDAPVQTLVVHMNRYNEAPDLCRLERSSDSTSPFTVDANDLDFMDGIDEVEEGEDEEEEGAGGEETIHSNMMLDSDDDDDADDHVSHHLARSRGRAGKQYAALEAHWVSRLLLPGRFSPSVIRRAISALDTGVKIRLGANSTTQADFVDASSASVSVAALACRAVNRRIDVLLRQKYALEATSISPAMSKMSAARAAWVELLDACAAAAQFEKLPCGFITMSTDRRRTRESSNFHCVAGIVRQGSVSMLRAATPLEDAWKRMEDLSSEGLLVTDFAVETSAVEEVLFCAGALLRAALVASEDTRDLVRSVAGMQPLLMLGRDDMNDDDDGSSNTNIGVEALASLQQLSMSLDRDGSGTAGRAIRQLTSHLRRHGASGFRAVVKDILQQQLPLRRGAATAVSAPATPDALAPSVLAAVLGANALGEVATVAIDLSVGVALALCVALQSGLKAIGGGGSRRGSSSQGVGKGTFSRTFNRAALPSRVGSHASEDRYLRSELSLLLRRNLLGGGGVLLRALLLRDFGVLRMRGETGEKSKRSAGVKARRRAGAPESTIFSAAASSSDRFPTMRLRRLALPRELDMSTCVSDGFLDLLAHDAAQPVLDHGGRIIASLNRQRGRGRVLDRRTGGGENDDGDIVGGAGDVDVSAVADGVRPHSGQGAGSGGRAYFRASAAGSALLPAAMRFFLQVVAVEPCSMVGGGSDPRQFVHDAATCWSSDVVGTEALAFSVAHVLAFLVSRGQVDYVSRICRAMLGNGGDLHEVELGMRGASIGGGIFEGRSGGATRRRSKLRPSAQHPRKDEDDDAEMDAAAQSDAEFEEYGEAEGSTWLDGVPELAYLRLLGECYLTTSNSLVTSSFYYRNDSNVAATSVSTTIPVFSAMHTSTTTSSSRIRSGTAKASSLILSDHHEAARAEHNMWLAFRYLLRSCPAAYIGGGGREVDRDGALGGVTQAILSELSHGALKDRVLFIMAMVEAFDAARRPRFAVLCARAGISTIGELNHRSASDAQRSFWLATLWSAVFTQTLLMRAFDEAWLAINSNPDPERRPLCRQQLVGAIYDARALDVLLRLPLVQGSPQHSLRQIVEALERKAAYTPIDFAGGAKEEAAEEAFDEQQDDGTDLGGNGHGRGRVNKWSSRIVTVQHYLYALHVKHEDYRKAAEAMFRLSKAAIAEGMPLDDQHATELLNPWHAKRALRRLRTQRTCLELCTDALTTATAALRLLPRSEDRYLLDRMQSQSKRETYTDGGTGRDREGGPNFHTVSESRSISREAGGAVDPRTGNLVGNPADAPLKLKVVWLTDVDAKLVLLRCRLALLARQERVARYNARIVASASDAQRRRGQQSGGGANRSHGVAAGSPSGTKRSYSGGPIDVNAAIASSAAAVDGADVDGMQPFLSPSGYMTDPGHAGNVAAGGISETLSALVMPAVDTGCASVREFELAIELVMKNSMGDRDATGTAGAGLSSSSSSSASSSSSYRVQMLDVVVRAIASAIVRTRKRKVEAARSAVPVTMLAEEEEDDDDGEKMKGENFARAVEDDIAFAEKYLGDAKRLEARMSLRLSRLDHLLKGMLRRLDGIETNFQLHGAAADAMLSEDSRVGLPTWLVRSFKGGVGALRYGHPMAFCGQKSFGVAGATGAAGGGDVRKEEDDDEVMNANARAEQGSAAVPGTIRETTRLALVTALSGFAKAGGHPTSLIEIYLAHGRLADACDVASTVLADVVGGLYLQAAALGDARPDTMLEVTHLPDAMVPHRVLDRLLDGCDEVLATANESTLILQTGGRGFDDKDDADLRAAAAVARASQLAKLRSSTHNLRAQLVAYFTVVVEHDAQTPAWQQARRAVGLQQSATGVPRSALEMQIGW